MKRELKAILLKNLYPIKLRLVIVSILAKEISLASISTSSKLKRPKVVILKVLLSFLSLLGEVKVIEVEK